MVYQQEPNGFEYGMLDVDESLDADFCTDDLYDSVPPGVSKFAHGHGGLAGDSRDGSLPDGTAQFILVWLASFPGMPAQKHYNAFSNLTGSSAAAIENWFAILLRSPAPQNTDSGYLSQSESTSGMSSSTSLSGGLSGRAEELCKAWLTNFAPMPTPQHVEALSCLVSSPASAIEVWFASLLRANLLSNSNFGLSKTPLDNSLSPSRAEQDNAIFSTSSADVSFCSDTSLSMNNELLLRNTEHSSVSTMFLQPPTDPVNTGALHNGIQPSRGVLRTRREVRNHTQASAQIRSNLGCNPTSDARKLKRNPSKLHQCTFKCGQSFAKPHDRKRHEELSYPQQKWVCLVEPVTFVDNVPCCSYCAMKNPPPRHMAEAHSNHLTQQNSGAQDFCGKASARLENAKDHFRKKHPRLPWEPCKVACYGVPDSNFPRYCGFCGLEDLEWSWEERHKHISAHFKNDECDMLQWQDKIKHNECENGQLDDDNDDDDDADDGTDDMDDIDHDNVNHDGPENRRHDNSPGQEPRQQRNPRPGSRGGKQRRLVNSQKYEVSEVNATMDAFKSRSNINDDPPWVCPFAQNPQSKFHFLRVWVDRDHIKSAHSDLHATKGTTKMNQSSCKTDSTPPQHRSTFPSRNTRYTGSAGKIPPGEQSCIQGPTSYGKITSMQISSQHLLGRGGFGVVDKVKDNLTGLFFARKTFLKTKEAEQSFENEMKALRILSQHRSEHVVNLVGYSSQLQSSSIFLSPVADMNLSQYLNTSIPTDSIAQSMMRQLGCLANALEYLHSGFHMRHRDIKPQNILVCNPGDAAPGRWLFSDFGLSKIQKAQPEIEDDENLQIGTKTYQPPEIYTPGSTLSKSWDIWSLGCVFAEVLSFVIIGNASEFRDYRQKHFRHNRSFWGNIPETQGWLEILRERSGSIYDSKINLIKSMLNPDQSLRPTPSEILSVFPSASCCLSTLDEFREQKEEVDANAAHFESIKLQRRAKSHVSGRNARKQMRSLARPSPNPHHYLKPGGLQRKGVFANFVVGQHSNEVAKEGEKQRQAEKPQCRM